jgi:hypothetical protein
MLPDIKLGDQERNRQIAKLKTANINRYTVWMVLLTDRQTDRQTSTLLYSTGEELHKEWDVHAWPYSYHVQDFHKHFFKYYSTLMPSEWNLHTVTLCTTHNSQQ